MTDNTNPGSMSARSCPAGVLLVEDERALQEAIGAFLEAHGYPTTPADGIDHALELLGDLKRPCLVLVDPMTIRVDWNRLFDALGPNDRVATIPMVLESLVVPALFTRPVVRKRPVDFEILLGIAREHCCGESGPARGHGSRDALASGEG